MGLEGAEDAKAAVVLRRSWRRVRDEMCCEQAVPTMSILASFWLRAGVEVTQGGDVGQL